jgi:hypothetical protein
MRTHSGAAFAATASPKDEVPPELSALVEGERGWRSER